MAKIVVCYVPGIHQGLLSFLEKYPYDLAVLGESLIAEVPRLDRDIRALDPEVAADMLSNSGLQTRDFMVWSIDTDFSYLPEDTEFIMPDEDVTRTFAATYLEGRRCMFVNTFLRWDRQVTTLERELSPDRVISTDALHQALIGLASREAEHSQDWWRQVGAVAVSQQGDIIGVGHNHAVLGGDYALGLFGDPKSNFDAGERIDLVKFIHAEASVIAQAARTGTALAGARIYVTTFPCPTCAKLVAAAGLTTVYYRDGYSLLDAEDIFKAYGIELVKVE